MAEVIGVAVAAGQLAVSCLAVLELTKKIKEAPSALKKYQEQLQDIRGLSDSISQNPLLQTAEVGLQTQSLRKIVEENSLETLLQRNRLHRTLGFLRKDKDLIVLLDTLERQKTQLSLIIHNIEASTLHQIQTDIRAMSNISSRSNGEGSSSKANNIIVNSGEQFSVVFSSTPSRAVAITSRKYRTRHSPTLEDDLGDGDAENNGNASDQQSYFSASIPYLSEEQHRRGFQLGSDSGSRTTYYRCHADEGVDQSNGPCIEFDDDYLDRLAKEQRGPPPRYKQYTDTEPNNTANGERNPDSAGNQSTYIDCVKFGNGIQVNGIDAIYSRPLSGSPGNNAHYSGCHFFSGHGFGPKKQINGNRMRRQNRN